MQYISERSLCKPGSSGIILRSLAEPCWRGHVCWPIINQALECLLSRSSYVQYIYTLLYICYSALPTELCAGSGKYPNVYSVDCLQILECSTRAAEK